MPAYGRWDLTRRLKCQTLSINVLLRLSQDWILYYGKKEDKNIVEIGMYSERRESGDLSSNLFKKKLCIVASNICRLHCSLM
jgi:hypothetical protein